MQQFRLARDNDCERMNGRKAKEANSMLFYSDDPTRDCVLVGYQGVCLTLGMRKLEPQKPAIACA